MLGLSKLEKLQEDATKLGLTFDKDATVVELEEMIEGYEGPDSEVPTEETKPEAPVAETVTPATEKEAKPSRKTVKEEPKKVKTINIKQMQKLLT